jgi:hypothetical protein
MVRAVSESLGGERGFLILARRKVMKKNYFFLAAFFFAFFLALAMRVSSYRLVRGRVYTRKCKKQAHPIIK